MLYVPSTRRSNFTSPAPSSIGRQIETRTRDIERSRSSSMRTNFPIDCTDGDQFEETPSPKPSRTLSNSHERSESSSQWSSASVVNDVVLMDRATANSHDNVKEMTILIVGNSNAGKSSFVYWCRERKFKIYSRATMGGEPSLIGAKVNGQHYVVTLMDTAGTERFQSVPQNWYRYADGAIVMYDIVDYSSFRYVTTWKQRVERNCRKDNIPYILVGNKVDIKDQMPIEGEQIAKELKMDHFVKTSAKTGEGIDEVIKTIVLLVNNVAASQPNIQSGDQPIMLERKRIKAKCC